jgi:mRNA-degrading endonuclease HigB of HigAB toxin-antitoxin module
MELEIFGKAKQIVEGLEKTNALLSQIKGKQANIVISRYVSRDIFITEILTKQEYKNLIETIIERLEKRKENLEKSLKKL